MLRQPRPLSVWRLVRTVYVDTGAFIALLWSRDKDHRECQRALRRLQDERARLVTAIR